MRINHNIASLNTYRQLTSNTGATSKSLEKLSSGLRINRAGDDAAGLAISEKMRGQIRGLDQAARNSQDSISLIQTAEGALNETHSIMQRMRELSVQAANDTNTADDRAEIQKEVNQLVEEIDRIGNQTEFNTKKLLNGGAGIQGNTNNANVAIAGGTASVKTGGQLVLTGVRAATTGSVAFTAQDTDNTFAAASGTFSINGVSISITNTDTAAQFLSKVNAVSSSTGVTVSGDYTGLTFASLGTGTNSKIDISGIDNVLTVAGGAATISHNVNGAGAVVNTTGSVSATGQDAAATIDAATTGIDPTSVTSSGNLLTFHGGDYDGLQLRVNATMTTPAGVTANITANNSLTMHIGANESQTMSISMNDMRSAALFINNLEVTTQSGAEAAITSVSNAIAFVSGERSKLGAYQNRLEHTINNLSTSSENLTASESRIRDVDMAKEMMEFTKNNILSQAAQAMLAQANQQPQGVLQLLR